MPVIEACKDNGIQRIMIRNGFVEKAAEFRENGLVMGSEVLNWQQLSEFMQRIFVLYQLPRITPISKFKVLVHVAKQEEADRILMILRISIGLYHLQIGG